MTADKGTLLFEADNTVQHGMAEGNVHLQSRGASIIDITGPRGDVNMGPNNSAEQAILSGGAKFESHGASLAHGSADKFILDFDDQNQPLRVHMVKDARMMQDPKPDKSGSSGQPMEIAADELDFLLENAGTRSSLAIPWAKPRSPFSRHRRIRRSRRAPARAIRKRDRTQQPWLPRESSMRPSIATTACERCMAHRTPRIVSTTPGDPDKVSVSRNLDVTFAPDGGVEKLIQTGDFQYHEASGKPDTGGREAFADVATYTPSDTMLVLTGSPRVIDNGVTTTAVTVRINRQTGDGFADDNVKTTYSDLKPQPDGALLASSDPVHVTAQHMTAHKQPGVAHYTGNVRLWQVANVVRAPKIDFDDQKRSLVAEADANQKVLSLFMQKSAGRKVDAGRCHV